MKFWDWFKKHSTPKEKEPQETFSQIYAEPDIIAELDLIDFQYILKEASVVLYQDTNFDEQSEHPGIIRAEMKEAADDMLVDWASGPKRLRDGAIHFYSCHDSLKVGMVFSIAFTDARCISLEEKATQREKETIRITKICFSPHSISIENERKTNLWR